MKYLILVYISLILVGCGKEYKCSNTEVCVHVDSFYREAAARNIQLPERDFEVKVIDSMPGRRIGMCRQNLEGKTVFIHSGLVTGAVPWSLEQVVFHELGHCVLDLRHSRGLMSEDSPSVATWELHKRAWLNDAFNAYRKKGK